MRARLLPASLLAGGLALQFPSGIDPSSLTQRIRPQDDLYAHVNAVWSAATPIPPDRVDYGGFAEVGDRVDERLHELIRDAARTRRTAAQRQVADLFASIVDETAIDARGAGPMRPVLDRIERIRTASALAAEAGRLSAAALGGPFGGAVIQDPDAPGRLTARITQGGTLLPEREHYSGQDARAVLVRERYVAYLATLFRLLERDEPEGEARRVLALETALAGHYWSVQDSRNPARTPTRYTFRQLAREMPGFDWAAWGRPQGLTDTGSVVLAQPSFFRAFAAMVPETPLETWKAWLRARYVTAVSPYVSDPFADARFEFFGRFLTGQQEPRPRWRRGVSLVGAHLADVIGRLYVERHFPSSSRQRVEAIAADVRAAFHEALGASSWLSSGALREAQQKLARLQIQVGSPDAWRDYGALTIAPDDLLGNIQRAQELERRLQVARAAGHEGPRVWPVAAHSVNAAYHHQANTIILPAGMLQPPFFDPAADDAVNYGALGGIIGHELSHAFDVRGRQVDAGGTARVWWAPADEQAFLVIANRLIAQAREWPAFTTAAPDGAPLLTPMNGTLTVIENAADLAGLSAAWTAWQRSLRGRPSPVLDGLTGEQRFFIGWARAWRTTVRPEYLRRILLTQAHAPAEFRVNAIVQHLDAFHAAFDVRPGDRLYRAPEARVRVW